MQFFWGGTLRKRVQILLLQTVLNTRASEPIARALRGLEA